MTSKTNALASLSFFTGLGLLIGIMIFLLGWQAALVIGLFISAMLLVSYGIYLYIKGLIDNE